MPQEQRTRASHPKVGEVVIIGPRAPTEEEARRLLSGLPVEGFSIAPEPTATEEFVSGALSKFPSPGELRPSPIAGPPGFGVMTSAPFVARAVGPMLRGILGEQGEQLEKGAVSLGQGLGGPLSLGSLGQVGQGAGRIIAGAVPAIGPSIARGVEKLPDQPARGAGELVGEAALILGPFGLARGARRVAAALGPRTAGSVVQGVPITRAQRRAMAGQSEGFIGLGEALGRQSRFGKGFFEQLDRRAQQALVDLGETVRGTVESLASTASRVNKGLEVVRDRFRLRFERLDNALDVLLGDAPVPASGAKRLVARVRKEGKEGPLPSLEDSTLSKVFDDIEAWGDTISFRDMLDARRLLNDLGHAVDDPVPGRRAGIARRFAAEVDRPLGEAAKRAGPQAVRAWKLRNATWKRVKETFNEGVIKKLANDELGRERLAQWLPTLSSKEIRRVRRFSGPENWRALQNKNAEFMMKKSTIREGIPGDVPGVARGTQVRGTVMNQMLEDSAMNETLRAIHEPVRIRNLRAFADLAAVMSRPPGRGLASLVGPSVDFGILGGMVTSLVSLVRGDVGTAAVAAGSAGSAALGIRVISKVLSNPEGSTALRRGVQFLARGDVAKANFWTLRLLSTLSDREKSEIFGGPEVPEFLQPPAPSSAIQMPPSPLARPPLPSPFRERQR